MRIQNIFNNPFFYKVFQSAVSKRSTTWMIEKEWINGDDSSRVLDFGCGVGHYSKLFKDQVYLGIEPIESCVQTANRFLSRENVEFRVGDHRTLSLLNDSSFDLILALGVIHHLNDEDFKVFLSQADRLLIPGGRLVTMDPVLHEKQSRISKWVVSKDRGEWVRENSDYVSNLENVFSVCRVKIYSGLLRIPYDHIFASVRK